MIANNKKKFNKIFVAIFAIVLLLPSIGLANLKLQQTYPAISGITGQSQSLNTAVSQAKNNAPTNTVSLIKYVFTLASIILIGLAVLALIIAGVQYLSSTGKPDAQKAARTRILKAFLGLAIVIGAALILQLISPNLNLPQITHIYSVSNVILISDTGLNHLREQVQQRSANQNAEGITQDFLDQLLDRGEIKYFGSQSGDLTQDFGQLTKFGVSPIVLFEDFQPAYIGFYGSGKENIKVKTFYGKNFLGTGHTYSTLNGLQNNDNTTGAAGPLGTELGIAGGIVITYFTLQPYLSTKSNIDYFDVATQKFSLATDSLKYPPLSMSVEGISAGVYLYGSETPKPAPPGEQPSISGEVDTGESIKYIGGKGGQRYLQFDISNFSDTAFDFDDEAMDIEIKNNRQLPDKTAQDDLLVFLFQGKYYQGPFRAFFATRQVAGADIYNSSNNKNWFDQEGIVKVIKDNFLNKGFNITKTWLVGNTTEKLKIDINAADQQGKVFGASSARVFHLAPTDNNNCQAVALCNAPDLQGYCLVFTPTGQSNNKWMSIFLPMPWLTPIPIPKELDKDMADAMLADDDQKKAFKEFVGLLEVSNREFEDNIKSIGIKGNCVVALYENAAKPENYCLTRVNKEECWDNKNPGAKSMVFSKNDMISGTGAGQTPYLNLKNYRINTCVSLLSALKLTPPHSCASAIAVYPVK